MYELGELTANEDAISLLIKAATNQIWMDISGYIKEKNATGRIPFFCTDVCKNGAFNWLAARLQVARTRSDQWQVGYFNPGDGGDYERGLIRRTGSTVLSASPRIEDRSVPYTWGNEGTPDKWDPSLREKFNKLPQGEMLSADSLTWFRYGTWDTNQNTNSVFAILSLDQHENFMMP